MVVGRPDEKPEFSIWDPPKMPYTGEDAEKVRREMREATASLGARIIPRAHMDFEGEPKTVGPVSIKEIEVEH